MMHIELISKIVLITVFSLFSILRAVYYRQAKKAGYVTVIEERKGYSIWLSAFICYEVFTFFLYIWFPQALAWATVPLPAWARILGCLLGVAALLWFVWIHRSLGSNHSARLRIKDRQVLVTDGPYRWIRHPMYSAFYLLHVAVFFLTANWFIGVTWLAGLTITILLRVRREEEMLLERFGDQYGSYMDRTGRFVPPVKLAKPRVK
ncbi:MAG: isoprenylcysteine carboxylmethyltransferase family protein [Dehalococcoidia bacterium]